MLVFKHEAVLGFIDRLVRDPEFAEWFVVDPRQALASYSLAASDLGDVCDVVEAGRYQQHLARALRPTMELLREIAENPAPDLVRERCGRLQDELRSTRGRVATAREERRRPWWKFW